MSIRQCCRTRMPASRHFDSRGMVVVISVNEPIFLPFSIRHPHSTISQCRLNCVSYLGKRNVNKKIFGRPTKKTEAPRDQRPKKNKRRLATMPPIPFRWSPNFFLNSRAAKLPLPEKSKSCDTFAIKVRDKLFFIRSFVYYNLHEYQNRTLPLS